jgi:hypothetical protein
MSFFPRDFSIGGAYNLPRKIKSFIEGAYLTTGFFPLRKAPRRLEALGAFFFG